jgi:hypothetical protein
MHMSNTFLCETTLMKKCLQFLRYSLSSLEIVTTAELLLVLHDHRWQHHWYVELGAYVDYKQYALDQGVQCTTHLSIHWWIRLTPEFARHFGCRRCK